MASFFWMYIHICDLWWHHYVILLMCVIIWIQVSAYSTFYLLTDLLASLTLLPIHFVLVFFTRRLFYHVS